MDAGDLRLRAVSAALRALPGAGTQVVPARRLPVSDDHRGAASAGWTGRIGLTCDMPCGGPMALGECAAPVLPPSPLAPRCCSHSRCSVRRWRPILERHIALASAKAAFHRTVVRADHSNPRADDIRDLRCALDTGPRHAGVRARAPIKVLRTADRHCTYALCANMVPTPREAGCLRAEHEQTLATRPPNR